MERIDIDTHVFTANKRGGRHLLFITAACVPLIGLFVYVIISMPPTVRPMKEIGMIAALTGIIFLIIMTLVSARKAYNYALDTKLKIDPIHRHFVYTHNRRTIEFDGDDVQTWYDNIGLKIGFGKLTRLTEHDSVLILKSGEVIYLHAWLWDGDYSWLHAGHSWEHNIKFYLEAHREQLHLPESKTAWTYKYMFAED